MSDDTDSRQLRNNPFFIIIVAIFIALTMVVVNLIFYYHSSTRQIVDGIQENKRDIQTNLTLDRSKTGPLTASELQSASAAIQSKLTSLDDDKDYNPDQLTDSALGL